VAGSFSQLHFDKDGTHGLLYQVYGRKRVVVIPAEASPKLAPLAQYSAWCLQNMSDRERRAFLRFTGGWETVLEPGDAVYLPALCWHFADYLEPCFGLNIRFRRSGLVTRLLNELYPDAHAQALCAALSDPARAPLGRALLADVERVKADARARGAPVGPALRALAAELHERVCPGQVPRGPYALDLEAHFPTPLPQFLDPLSPDRPHYT
jgi:lysine-specific demethylase 8